MRLLTNVSTADMLSSGDVPVTDQGALAEKLLDLMTPGWMVEFDPDEADLAGAFVEDALSESDALSGTEDLPEALEVYAQEMTAPLAVVAPEN